ncbi:hypothetical protein Pint_22580 [Pistacia integerrima]|uniref:Uncharacterized protein n=1 Tax=Pistacia integerrima TaxID=434235 RepID=A0ACC0YMG0_9ROSI|nr:hypothetical protein Pint_22580 [Pistacia integerrima]
MSFLVVVCAAENKWRCDGFMEERGEIGEKFSMELKGFLGAVPKYISPGDLPACGIIVRGEVAWYALFYFLL